MFTIIVLGTRLLDRADKFIGSVALQLPRFGALRPVTMAVVVVIAPIFMAVVIAARWAISPGDPGDFLIMVLVGLFSISVLYGRLEHLTDCC